MSSRNIAAIGIILMALVMAGTVIGLATLNLMASKSSDSELTLPHPADIVHGSKYVEKGTLMCINPRNLLTEMLTFSDLQLATIYCYRAREDRRVVVMPEYQDHETYRFITVVLTNNLPQYWVMKDLVKTKIDGPK
jgi:hypothetical protein